MRRTVYDIYCVLIGVADALKEAFCQLPILPALSIVVGAGAPASAMLTGSDPRLTVIAWLVFGGFVALAITLHFVQYALFGDEEGHVGLLVTALLLGPTMITASIWLYELTPGNSTLPPDPGYASLIPAALGTVIASAVFIALIALVGLIVAFGVVALGIALYKGVCSFLERYRRRGRKLLESS